MTREEREYIRQEISKRKLAEYRLDQLIEWERDVEPQEIKRAKDRERKRRERGEATCFELAFCADCGRKGVGKRGCRYCGSQDTAEVTVSSWDNWPDDYENGEVDEDEHPDDSSEGQGNQEGLRS